MNMTSKYLKLTLPERLYNDALELVNIFGYSNIQDLTIDSLRQETRNLKKELALINLEKNFGSKISTKKLTKNIRESISLKHTPSEARAITKKYNLKDIKV